MPQTIQHKQEVIYATDSNIEASGLSFSSGQSKLSIDGGAIALIQTTAQSNDIVFVETIFKRGGALYSDQSHHNMTDVTFVSNNASEGGALYDVLGTGLY